MGSENQELLRAGEAHLRAWRGFLKLCLFSTIAIALLLAGMALFLL